MVLDFPYYEIPTVYLSFGTRSKYIFSKGESPERAFGNYVPRGYKAPFIAKPGKPPTNKIASQTKARSRPLVDTVGRLLFLPIFNYL